MGKKGPACRRGTPQVEIRDRLASMVYVDASPIHGRGVFARVPIPKGAYIGTYRGREARRDGTYVLWLIGADGLAIGRSGRNQLRFLNHSKKPNAYFEEFELYALRRIRAGEEITFDYNWD